jgi:hypothetical protein
MGTKKHTLATTVAFTLALGLGAAAQEGTQEPVRIGAIVSTTGGLASLGIAKRGRGDQRPPA